MPTQAKFHASPARHKCFIGAFGAGKTLVGGMEALMQSLEYPQGGPPGLGLVARYEYKELIDTTWKMMLDIIPPEIIKDTIKAPPTGPRIILKTGFEIVGWNLKSHTKLSSLNLAWFWLDECNEDGIDESLYKQLRGRLRDPRGSRCSLLTGNPAGKNWVYNLFFAHLLDPSAKRYPDHEGFQAKSVENIYLPDDYVEHLREFYDDVWVEKYLEGSFDIFEGQVFDNFSRHLHVVPDLHVPPTWPRFRGLDHGLVNPTACLWLASDFEGNYLGYRNYYQRNSVPAENSAAILALSGDESIDWTVIDPSTRQQQTAGGTAERLIDQYSKAGLYCIEGDNHVRDSIARIRQLLQPDKAHRFPSWHPRAGEMGSPHLFFTDACKELIWEISQYQWKQIKPGQVDREIPLAKHDHLIACLRYLVMRSPRPAVETVEPTQWERFQAIVREMEGERAPDPDGVDYANVIGNEHLTALARR